jgi:hypothetical protein
MLAMTGTAVATAGRTALEPPAVGARSGAFATSNGDHGFATSAFATKSDVEVSVRFFFTPSARQT